MPGTRPTIFFSAGEPSGDHHAAELVRRLAERSSGIEAVGYGGPQMAAAGCALHADMTRLAVMWFARALANLPRFLALYRRADRYFRDQPPEAVVLVDYPGFNWWIASAAKSRGIPVFYYAPPQIWAWGSWRVKKVRRYVDHVLCSLPFEEPWFRERGCRADYVGHPFFDTASGRPLDEGFLAEQRSLPGPLVTLLPGSRTQEVSANLPAFLRAAAAVRGAVPDVRLAVAAFRPSHADFARRAAGEAGLPIAVHTNRTAELIHLAHCCMACSGSVSLELLAEARPTVIHYRISRLGYFVQQFFRHVKYITLVNLLAADALYPADLSPFDPCQPDADRVPFPEYLTWEDKSDQLAAHVTEWLVDREAYHRRVRQLVELRERVAASGAADRAAETILAGIAPPAPRAALSAA